MNRTYQLFPFFLLFIFLIFVPVQAHAEWVIDRNGHINFYQRGHVLGDSIENESETSSGKGKSNETSGTSSSGTNLSGTSSSGKTSGENIEVRQTSTPRPSKTPTASSEFGISEKDLQELESIDAMSKKVDVDSSGVEKEDEIEIEHGDDGLHITSGKDSSLDDLKLDEDVLTLEDKLGNQQVKIATASGGSLVLFKSDIGARTTLPVSVNLQSNVLSVTTSQGVKTITLLPDQAVEKLMKAGVLDTIDDGGVSSENSPSLKSVSHVFNLETKDGGLVYRIHGVKNKKVLGIFPVTIEKDLTVSAANGAVITTQKSLENKILDRISI